MAAAGGPPLNAVPFETQGASAAKGFTGEQNNAQIDYSALATASLVNSALGAIQGGGGALDMKATTYKDLSARLSSNTLSAWSKGAMLVTGDSAQCNLMFGQVPTQRLFTFASPADFPANGIPNEFLKELRRKYGNDWGAAMKAAEFLKTKQDEALHTQIWDAIPSTHQGVADWDPSHRGWDTQNQRTGAARWA